MSALPGARGRVQEGPWATGGTGGGVGETGYHSLSRRGEGSFLSATLPVKEIPSNVKALEIGSIDHFGGDEGRLSLKLGRKMYLYICCPLTEMYYVLSL